jgi:hypothetical protein
LVVISLNSTSEREKEIFLLFKRRRKKGNKTTSPNQPSQPAHWLVDESCFLLNEILSSISLFEVIIHLKTRARVKNTTTKRNKKKEKTTTTLRLIDNRKSLDFDNDNDMDDDEN